MLEIHHQAKTLVRITISTILLSGIAAAVWSPTVVAGCSLRHEKSRKILTMADGNRSLILTLNYGKKCVIEKIVIRGKEVASPPAGVYSGIRTAGAIFTTEVLHADPIISTSRNHVVVRGIRFGQSGQDVEEQWTFTLSADHIRWKIERTYRAAGIADEVLLPAWNFDSISTWTGALLGNGGVAWFKLFDSLNATYGVHTNSITLWNKENDACLKIATETRTRSHIAVRFSRQPNDQVTCSFSVTDAELIPKYDPGVNRRRYLPSRQDIWNPAQISAEKISVEYDLRGLDYSKEYDRGTIKHFNGEAVGMLLNTVARVGVVDTRLHGSNSWRTPYGPVCLQEQWIAQMGLAIDDPDYLESYKSTLDYFRDHAIEPDGRVKPRWAYTCEDAMAGKCDSLGFYEAQWGYLLDSNSDFVTNVAELFDLTGDQTWVRTQKSACEQALDYLLNRDANGNGLVEMMSDSHTEERGSDWIDIMWASYENALVNAKLYYALTLWSSVETTLGDLQRASLYRSSARRLRACFDKPTDQGGFWDPLNKWYVYWRDEDNSIHGNNLTIPVNFMTIAYGICDDTTRARALLDRIEEQMQKERLFAWPLCMFSFAPGEGKSWQWPFPIYENGDIFLSWAEVGIRAYASYDPRIPLKYIDNILAKYKEDGLAYQRYSRTTQNGLGDDILANNCLAIVGLYRDIYGIQPKFNRLFLEPHLSPELNGTILKYRLRGQAYKIRLSVERHDIEVNDFAVRASNSFGMSSAGNHVEYFHGGKEAYSLVLTRDASASVQITVERWDTSGAREKRWVESCSDPKVSCNHRVADLKPDTPYAVYRDGKVFASVRSDARGEIKFHYSGGFLVPHTFEVKE